VPCDSSGQEFNTQCVIVTVDSETLLIVKIVRICECITSEDLGSMEDRKSCLFVDLRHSFDLKM
jgi:hypothetical protein